MNKFSEVYTEVVQESGKELEKLRKEEMRRKVSISIVIIIISAIIIGIAIKAKVSFETNMLIVFGIIAIFLRIFIFKPKIGMNKRGPYGEKTFNSEYKQKVIRTFVKAYDEKLNYFPERGISSSEYKEGKFDRMFDRYYSEDLIEGEIEETKIKISEVQTEKEETDKDGNRYYATLFHGMFGIIELNQIIPSIIQIRSNANLIVTVPTKIATIGMAFEKIELDSSEFEKIFDVYTDNKIQAMQILTADVMAEMIDFYNKYKIAYEITITGSNIYIRFKTGSIFEGNILKSAIDFDELKKNYDIINFMFNVSKKIANVINQKEL